MKIQDLIFLAVFIFLFFKSDAKTSVIFGISALILAIPLFATWTFFTAERLTFYAAAFFLQVITFQLWKLHQGKL